MRINLVELVGSLIVGKISGSQLTSDEEKLLQHGYVSGVTLFKENAESLTQLVRLIDSIYRLRHDAIIAVDQEGGAVQRFDHVLSPLPSQMAMAASTDRNAVEKIAAINSRQLKLLGVNFLLTPVLDICCNPSNPIIGSRSFGSLPQQVAELGVRYAQTVLDCGLIPVGKHFPGHGDVSVDSHTNMPTLTVSKEQLFARELVPFQRCMSVLPALMVGHISVPAVDTTGVPEGTPASLSYHVITELLKNQLGFEGMVITDDLMMGAVTKHYDPGQAAVKAIAAGADQVLIGGDCASILSAHAALMSAVEKGVLSEARIVQSMERIKKTRGVYSLGKFTKQTSGVRDAARIREKPDTAQSRIAKLEACIPDDSMTCHEIMQSAICLLRGGLPDVIQGHWNILIPDHPRYRFDLSFSLPNLPNLLPQLRFPLDPTVEDITAAVNKVKQVNTNCIILGFRSSVYAGQIKLAQELNNELCAQGHELYCIEIDVPSGFAGVPALKNVMATFDPSEAAISVLSKMFLSKRHPLGQCPVLY